MSHPEKATETCTNYDSSTHSPRCRPLTQKLSRKVAQGMSPFYGWIVTTEKFSVKTLSRPAFISTEQFVGRNTKYRPTFKYSEAVETWESGNHFDHPRSSSTAILREFCKITFSISLDYKCSSTKFLRTLGIYKISLRIDDCKIVVQEDDGSDTLRRRQRMALKTCKKFLVKLQPGVGMDGLESIVFKCHCGEFFDCIDFFFLKAYELLIFKISR